MAFCGSFSAPTYFTLSKFCPLKFLLTCGFTCCLISTTTDAALELAAGGVEVAFNKGHLQIGQKPKCLSLGIFWCNAAEPGRQVSQKY